MVRPRSEKCKHGHLMEAPNLIFRIRSGRTFRECRKCANKRAKKSRMNMKKKRKDGTVHDRNRMAVGAVEDAAGILKTGVGKNEAAKTEAGAEAVADGVSSGGDPILSDEPGVHDSDAAGPGRGFIDSDRPGDQSGAPAQADAPSVAIPHGSADWDAKASSKPESMIGLNPDGPRRSEIDKAAPPPTDAPPPIAPANPVPLNRPAPPTCPHGFMVRAACPTCRAMR